MGGLKVLSPRNRGLGRREDLGYLALMRNPADLPKCVEFINEIEKLKVVYRQNSVVDHSRQENSAEHSWHVTLMAVLLAGFSNDKGLDLLKIVKMLLIHDIVEIDAGDTFLYDAAANESKADAEREAAKRIFGILPEALGNELLGLWEEFEKRTGPEAKFAAALDSLQPLMNHLNNKNLKYRDHQVRTAQVLEKKKHIAEGSAVLWEYAQEVIRKSEAAGLYLGNGK
jgi:putative hydrolase of HD superfamily